MTPDEEALRIQSSFCRVFSSPKRLQILWYLSKGERSVGEIAEALGSSLANASQHLGIMREQGAVRMRKDGQTVYYRVSNQNFVRCAQLVHRGLVEEGRIREPEGGGSEMGPSRRRPRKRRG